MKEYWELFYSFAKIGAFTFGGGYAMLPLIQREVVEKKHWATEEEIMDGLELSLSSPLSDFQERATAGILRTHGIPYFSGGIFATLGVIFPSIVIILLIASLLQNFSDLAIVQHALGGIRVAVCVLVLNAVIKLFKSGVKDFTSTLIFCLTLLLAFLQLIPTIVIIITAACLGIGIQLYKAKKEVKSS